MTCDIAFVTIIQDQKRTSPLIPLQRGSFPSTFIGEHALFFLRTGFAASQQRNAKRCDRFPL